jgi:S1-C subfamily serine protease
MSLLDLILVGIAIAAGVGGYRLGFVTRVISWFGLAVGVFVASRLLPPLLRRLRPDLQPDALLLVSVGTLLFGALLGQASGMLAGSRLHVAIRSPEARRADRVVGAVAGVAGVLLAVWVVSPAMGSVPGWSARETRHSAIVREVHRLFPGAPDTARSMRRLLGPGYPEVFGAFQPAPKVGPVPAAAGLDQATAQRIADSTVKVLGPACGLEQEGSGFVVAPGLVATNAHVVAGEHRTYVLRGDGMELRATPIAFDPVRDLALLQVDGLDRPALPIAASADGQAGGVFGHPHGGPLTISPFRTDRKQTVVGSDIYSRSRSTRSVLFLASDLAPGDSGAALVTPAGQVVGVAFAIAPDKPGVAYALDTAELQSVMAAAGTTPVSTGACVAA